MRVAVSVVAAVALLVPASAFAHASLVSTSPANGAVLDTSPRTVIVRFDDTVRVGSGNAALANATRHSVLGGPATAHGRVLTIPLQPNLARGDYSVRWSIVSDDGHPEEGVIAFAVGAGSAPPQSVLGASVSLTWSVVLLRTLWYLGLLAAGGAAVFGLFTRRLLPAARRPLAHLLFFALLCSFVGGGGLASSAPSGTRFDLVLKVALGFAAAGAAAAALAPSVPLLYPAAQVAALLLLVLPTLSGHALDRDQPQILAAIVDVVHLASAAVWLGGLCALAWAVPRATADPELRRAATRRFSGAALVAVALLGATGLLRVLTELSSVSQAWSTSYGRALLVKTGIFLPLIATGYVNRRFLLDTFARLQRSVRLEIVAIAGIVVAVAILTELRPGVEAPKAAAAPAVPQPPVLPPRDAVVAARELGDLAVAIAREPQRTTVTILDSNGNGADGRTVTIGGAPAVTCGSGCYRGPASSTVTVDGNTLAFAVPARAPDASAKLARVRRAYRNSRTIVFEERLASSPTDVETTRFTVVAPNRLTYVTRGGPQAIVIGSRRWDRNGPKGRWVETPQTPLDVTQPYWQSPTNVHEIAPGVFTFLDRSIPAWFELEVAHGLPSVQHMTAASHFMVDRYVGFDVPVTVSPPSR